MSVISLVLTAGGGGPSSSSGHTDVPFAFDLLLLVAHPLWPASGRASRRDYVVYPADSPYTDTFGSHVPGAASVWIDPISLTLLSPQPTAGEIAASFSQIVTTTDFSPLVDKTVVFVPQGTVAPGSVPVPGAGLTYNLASFQAAFGIAPVDAAKIKFVKINIKNVDSSGGTITVTPSGSLAEEVPPGDSYENKAPYPNTEIAFPSSIQLSVGTFAELRVSYIDLR